MTARVPGVACVYCGQRHESPAEVRKCWEGSLGSRAAPRSLDAVSGPMRAPVGPGPGHGAQALGRSVLVKPGQEAPPAWRECERVRGGAVDELEKAWRERTPLVLEVDGGEAADGDEVERGPVWSLSPSFSFPKERWANAVFSNSFDAREGLPEWRLAGIARELGASGGGPADVVLPDGRPAFCDGGPLEWREPFGAGSEPAVIVHRSALLGGSLAPFGSNRTGAELAPDQLAAVTEPAASARVIAPAGSGKTRVLTERARHLLRNWRLPARGVTLVAFNKKAAEEMRARTPDLPDLRVRTLNALGLSLLAGLGSAATIEEREVRSLLAGLVHVPRRANTDPLASWIDALSVVRLGLRSPKEVEQDFGGDVDGLPEVFSRYRRLLADQGKVDFDEQVYKAIEALLTDPEARRRARASCRVLLVDEFQDLTPAHLLLVRLLAGPDGAVFGVGDDDQTIYGYSGASPEWLIRFRSFFPMAAEHALTVNYRCPPEVVEGARRLLSHNLRRVGKEIVAVPGRSARDAELTVVMAGDEPLSSTVAAVETLLAGGASSRDIAVLSRVNASLAGVQVALVHRGVPVQPAVDVAYLARSGVQAALSWLRLATAPAGRLPGRELALAARRPSRALSPKVVQWMSEQPSIPKLEGLASRLSSRDGEKINGFLSDLRLVRKRAETGATVDVLRAVRDDMGLDRSMELLDGSRRRLDRSAQADDLDALVALAALHPGLDDFEQWLHQSLRHPGSADGVALSTVHRVKGREWPHVVLHGATGRLFPHRLAADVEEERRVFHVGITRCSVSVHVVAGEPPSPFVAELSVLHDPVEAKRSRNGSSWVGRTGLPWERAQLGRQPISDRQGDVPKARLDRPLGSEGVQGSDAAVPPEAVESVRQALRAWRSQRAEREHKPAYVFLHDRTIDVLASRPPATMAALARAPGIGPAKLDAYGDELLALIDQAFGPHRAGSPG